MKIPAYALTNVNSYAQIQLREVDISDAIAKEPCFFWCGEFYFTNF